MKPNVPSCVRCASALATLIMVTACSPAYKPPALPVEQLATLTLDARASVVTLDGLRVAHMNTDRELYIGPGCRELFVKYEESFFIWGEKKAKKSGAGDSLTAILANTENHDYETTKPIHFTFGAKPSHKYWVTASFTGDQFLPRVVDIDPSGESVAHIIPEQKCGAPDGAQ